MVVVAVFQDVNATTTRCHVEISEGDDDMVVSDTFWRGKRFHHSSRRRIYSLCAWDER